MQTDHADETEKIQMHSEPIRESTGTDELRHAYITAKPGRDMTNARRALVENLTERYGGIDASVLEQPGATEHLVRFSRLMKEWNPIHFYLDDLKAIAGKPTKETPEEVEYWFYGGGDAPAVWRFTLDNDLIVGVRYFLGQ
jgi:hypothetical protein